MLEEQRRYWLGHCTGFRVVSEDGRVGEVAAPLVDPSNGEALGLLLRCGLFRQRLVHVPAEHIVEIEPRRRRISVRGSPPRKPAPAPRHEAPEEPAAL